MAKILIVDDDPDIVEAGRLVLEREGYEVESASNRAEGMKAIEEVKPDLLILDVMMEEPDDGLRMAREIRKRRATRSPSSCSPASTPPWACNIDKDEEMVPVDEFQSKPVDPQTLIAKVKTAARAGEDADARDAPGAAPRGRRRPWSTSSAGRSLIPILQDVKKQYHGIDSDAMQIIADLLDIHPVEVYSVATFYAFLDPAAAGRVRRPPLPHRLVRAGRQGRRSPASSRRELGIGFGETTDDGRFTLEWANCMGMCDQGPALLVNDRVYTRVTPETVREIVGRVPRRATAGHAAERKEGYLRMSIKTQGNTLTFASIDGDAGLKAALAMSRADIIDTVADSGMKGRGGAGFPTGMKWNFAAAEKGDAQVHHLQRRRGRAGHVQGPRHPHRVRRPGLRGHDHRRPRHRRRAGHRLPARRVHVPALRTSTR